LFCILLALAGLVFTASARAQLISPAQLGADFSLPAGGLSIASASGAQLARVQVIEASDFTATDAVVKELAKSNLELAPFLGLPCPPGTPSNCPDTTSWAPLDAASEMSSFITSFAQRYGPNGTFWQANPHLPYLPVTRYEIGNEPNLPLAYGAGDQTHLHWDDPASYALVYTEARASLHAVNPSDVAVVGGLADTTSHPVDLASVERSLQALNPSEVDAVAYHPYVFEVNDNLLWSETWAVRSWMYNHGLANVPLDVNEFGSCNQTPANVQAGICLPNWPDATQWGHDVASFTQWALCTPAAGIATILPEYWGGYAGVDDGPVLPMLKSDAQTLTPLGQQYLAMTQSLTTQGCPATPPAPPVPLPPLTQPTPPVTTPPTTPPPNGTPAVGKPTVAGAISGLPAGRAKLRFTVKHGTNAPNIRSIVLTPAKGLAVKKCTVKNHKCPGLSVSGATLSSVKVSGGRLVITLTGAVANVTITVSAPVLVESKSLQSNVKTHKVKTLTFTVRPTDARGTATSLSLKLKA
jgi:hypothetical protein